jgi:hypothetical protein
VVSASAGEELAKEFNIPFMETSAVQSVNVDEAFDKLIHSVYNRLEEQGLINPRPSVGGMPSSTAPRSPQIDGKGGSKGNAVQLGQQPPGENISCC